MKEFQYCPHCKQKMMVYRRAVRKSAVIGLMRLFNEGPQRTRDLDIPLGARSDFTTLKLWGLIYKHLVDGKKDLWAVTNKGKDFLFGNIAIPKYIFVYNNNVQNRSVEMVKVQDILELEEEFVDFESMLEDAQRLDFFISKLKGGKQWKRK